MPLASLALLVLLASLPVVAALVCAERVRLHLRRRHGLVGAPRRIERRLVWIPCAAILVGFIACVAYAFLVEPHWVEVTRTEIAVDRPVLGQPRFRIVHLSDLHLEGGLGRRERAVIERVRELKPHLIVLTGDYMNDRGSQNDLVNFLKALEAPHGVWAVGGNWDGKFPTADLFASGGHRYLQDDYELLEAGGGRLLIVGQDWPGGKSLAQLVDGASPDAYRLFLQHSPDAVDELPRGSVDLMLCGHTHGGQVRLPLYGALVTLTRQGKRFEQGLYRVAPPATANPRGTAVYVSRGIGMTGIAPRLRFLARPEVAVIELVAKK